MREVVIAAVIASSCYLSPPVDPVLALAGTAVKSQAELDRRANDEANAEAEKRRQRENASIRDTGKMLETPDAARRKVDPTRPANLTPAMIKTGIDEIRAAVMACRTGTLRGQVLVAVSVSAEGLVETVEVVATPDPRLGSCVSLNTHQATFPKTQRGGRFRYPFFF